MSKRLEYTIKGFIIGALIDYALQIIFRLIFGVLRFSIRFWYIVFPLIAYLYIYHEVSYWWNNEAERDAIYAFIPEGSRIPDQPPCSNDCGWNTLHRVRCRERRERSYLSSLCDVYLRARGASGRRIQARPYLYRACVCRAHSLPARPNELGSRSSLTATCGRRSRTNW